MKKSLNNQVAKILNEITIRFPDQLKQNPCHKFEKHLKDFNYSGESTLFEEVLGYLRAGARLDVEFNFFSDAIAYLALEDQSLSESIEIAKEQGVTEYIDSCLLASLLATRKLEEQIKALEEQINNLI